MKKILISIFSLFMLISITSCDEFLSVDPVDKQVKESYFTSESAVRANTASLYGRVWWDYINSFMIFAGDMMSGDMLYTYADEGQFFYNTVTPNNRFSLNAWDALFLVGSYANSVIIDMPEMAKAGGVSEEVINKALGEAYLFRGLAYYFLTEYWGEVPIIENASDLITSGNANDMYVNKSTQGSLYRFICEDLEKAVELLPEVDAQAGRVTKFSAKGLLAKVYLTRGCFVKGGGVDSGEGADYFAKSMEYAEDVILNGPRLAKDYSTMYDVASNNCSESLIAFQATVAGYGLGNSRTIQFSRNNDLIGASCWGAGKTVTISLQEEFAKQPNDGRRKWVYMQLNDKYDNLGKDAAGYTYLNYNSDLADYSVWTDEPGTCLTHMRKYVIHSNGGKDVGTNQDGGNNLYLLRLSDVYFVYAEAALKGDINGTLTDSKALGYINQVLNRGGDSDAGYTVSSLSYVDLIKERRKEFAIEGINWFDIKRMYYLNGQTALDYLNNMYRDMVWVLNWDKLNDTYGESVTNEQLFEAGNNPDFYLRNWNSPLTEKDRVDCGPTSSPDLSNRGVPVTMTDASMYIAIPADASTKAPILLEPAVDYYQSVENK